MNIKKIKSLWGIAIAFLNSRLAKLLLVGTVAILAYLLLTVEPDIKVVQKDNSDLIAEVKRYKDKEGDYVAKIKQHELSKEETEKRADSLARLLKIKPKTVQGVDQYFYKTDTVFKNVSTTVYVDKDGDTAYKVEKHDPWIDITAIAYRDSTKSTIDYKSRDTLTRVETKTNPLFGKSKTDVVIKNSNPYNVLQSGYSFSLKHNDPWLVIGPSIGYSIINKGVSVGVTATVPILKLRKK